MIWIHVCSFDGLAEEQRGEVLDNKFMGGSCAIRRPESTLLYHRVPNNFKTFDIKVSGLTDYRSIQLELIFVSLLSVLAVWTIFAAINISFCGDCVEGWRVGGFQQWASAAALWVRQREEVQFIQSLQRHKWRLCVPFVCVVQLSAIRSHLQLSCVWSIKEKGDDSKVQLIIKSAVHGSDCTSEQLHN